MKQFVNAILFGVISVGGHVVANPVYDGDVPYLMDGGGTEANPFVYIIGESGAYNADFGSSGIAVGWQYSWNELLVRNGSTLSASEGMWIGVGAGVDSETHDVSNHNTVTIDASTLQVNSLDIGIRSKGLYNSLFVRNGGTARITVGDLRIGLLELGMGGGSTSWYNQLVVSGQSSSLEVAGQLIVGDFGSHNSMTVESGGRAEAGSGLVIGGADWPRFVYASADNNRVLVTGADSVIEVNGEHGLAIAAALGSGNTLEVTDGGVVHVEADVNVGNVVGSGNQIVVSGAGSTLTAERLSLGARESRWMGGEPTSGSAELRIEDGGTVQIRGTAWIGSHFGGDNQVLVSGRNSMLQVGENLWLNSAAPEMPDGLTVLTIADGGIVKVEGDVVLGVGVTESEYIRLDGGYLALAGDKMDGLMYLLLNGVIQVWNPELGIWENALGSAYFAFGYFDSDEAAAAFTGYSGLGGYTILTSIVPEPATYALMLGGAAASLLLLRRRSR